MNKRFDKSLFIFRRDLRIHDNSALLQACRDSYKVVPVFILDPRQLEKNRYKSTPAVKFMYDCLIDLNQTLEQKGGRLHCLSGAPEKIIAELIRAEHIDAVYLNKDYTPFSIKRDAAIARLCDRHGIVFNAFDDALLHPPGSVHKKDGSPYTIFTPFFKRASQSKPAKAGRFSFSSPFTGISSSLELLGNRFNTLKENTDSIYPGGRIHALKLLRRATRLTAYDQERDLPAEAGTSRLSAHHKFGTVSIREVYWKIAGRLGEDHTLIRELYWRDFFTHIAFHFPHVFKGCFYRQYDAIKWRNNNRKFKAWQTGRTGYPLVDAGMRELNNTGFMHNRVRMVVASFLTKDLHIDWRKGERYFATRLVDYDPSVNNGNWQWAASTGCDAQPYFRIFNPWRQQERFDPECRYVKLWVPELADSSSKEIHGLGGGSTINGYPAPIVDHSEARDIAEDLYLDARAAANNRK